MAEVFGCMAVDEAWRFASISEFNATTRHQVYEAVGERVLAAMFADPENLPEPCTYLVQLRDKRIIGFPCAVTARVMPVDS